LRKELAESRSFEAILAVTQQMRQLREENTPEQKLGWYYRHWKSMNLSVEETKTFSMLAWDE